MFDCAFCRTVIHHNGKTMTYITAHPLWTLINLGYTGYNESGNDPASNCRVCTSTLIESGSRRILVDPGLNPPDIFKTCLKQRTGYEPRDIDTVFLTHFHRHHWESLSLFLPSVWLMSRVEIHWWQNHAKTSEEERDILARIVPIEEHTLPGIDSLFTSGHTHGSSSLMFEAREGIVVIAGDAVPRFDCFDEREPPDHVEDEKEARRSIDRIAKIADVVVPGHDNYFVV